MSASPTSRVTADRVLRVVALAAVLGTVSSLVVSALWAHRDAGPVVVPAPIPWVAALLLVVTVAAEMVSVRLRHGDEEEALTLLEAAVVADVLLLPPAPAIAVAALGLAIASLLTRRPAVKTVFNLGAHAFGTALLVAAVAAVRAPGAGLDAATVAAVLVGTVLFAVGNLGLLALVLSAAAGVPVRATVRESWRLSGVMAVGTCGLGAVAVAVALSAPALLPFTLLPAAALTYAYRAAAQQAQEQERTRGLVGLSQVLAGRLVADDLLADFLVLLRETFNAESVRVVLEGDDERPGHVALACPSGKVAAAELTALDAALLARVGDVAEVVTEGLPEGWGPTLLAPLGADERNLGVLALVAPAGGRVDERDLVVLTPLVSALGVALRGAEHLSRLVEESAKLKAVVDHSSDGILVLDADGRVLVWNAAMEQVSGLPEDLACGRRLSDLLGATDEDGRAVDPVAVGWSLLTPDRPRATVEMGLVRPDGEQRWVRASHAAVFDQGTIVQDVVLVADVTRERHVERLKADFIATVSHELRTPITPVKGYVDLLRRRGESFSPEKRREMLDTVADRVAHLARLVEDLLLASQVSSPASTVQLQAGDLAALVRRATDDFTTEAHRLRVDVAGEAVPVRCDPVRVVQVVSNLVSNGLKYSPSDRPVDVRVVVAPERSEARVEVEDRGRGIPADQQERVFDKFHRVEDALRMTTSGTGLGLFIARQLAEAMGGALGLRSTLGAGSTFTFTLPLAPEVAPDLVGVGPGLGRPANAALLGRPRGGPRTPAAR